MACRWQSHPAKQTGTNRVPESFELAAQEKGFTKQGLSRCVFLLVGILPWMLREKGEGYWRWVVADAAQPGTGDPRTRGGALTPVVPTVGQLWSVGDSGLGSRLLLAAAVRDLPQDLHTMLSLFPPGPSLLHPYPNLVFLTVPWVISATPGIAGTSVLLVLQNSTLQNPQSSPLSACEFWPFLPCLPLNHPQNPSPPHGAVPTSALRLALSSLMRSDFSRHVPQFSTSVPFIKPQARDGHWPAHLPAAWTGKK